MRTTRVISAAAAACGAFLALGLALAGTARASDSAPAASDGYVTLTYTGDDLGMMGYVTYGGKTIMTEVGQSSFNVSRSPSTYAGLGAAMAESSTIYTGYCLDPLASLERGVSYDFGVSPLTSAPSLSADQTSNLQKLFNTYGGDVVDNASAAAFDAAVLEIVYGMETNGSYNVLKGSFTVKSVAGQNWDLVANEWLAGIAADPDPPACVLASSAGCSFALASPTSPADEIGGSSAPVPEPLTMFSGFFVAAAIGSYLRKRARVK